MGKPRSENAVGFDRVENLSPEVARRAAIAFLVHGLKWKFNLCQLIPMYSCNRGNILSRNIWLKYIGRFLRIECAAFGFYYNRWQLRNWKRLKSRRIWKKKHPHRKEGRDLRTMAIILGFLSEKISYNVFSSLLSVIPYKSFYCLLAFHHTEREAPVVSHIFIFFFFL